MTGQHEHKDLHPNSLVTRDFAEQQTVADLADIFAIASKESGRSTSQMLREVKQASKWPGRMTRYEYVAQRLYELDKKQRKEFLTEWLHWPIHDVCMDAEWSEKTVDKWECTEVLLEAGIPTIPILAMVDTSELSYGKTPKIATEQQLAELLRSTELPLFAKPNRLLGSFGAFRIDALDGDDVIANGGDFRVPLEGMIEELMADVSYVLQHVVENHADIRAFAEGLATVRTVNFSKGGSVRMARAVLKIPVAGNFADNSWREGNLTANVDPATGVIDRVIRGIGPDMVTLTHHPDTETPLVGMALPDWDKACALNEQTAQLFAPINYQSQDIAFTTDGPLVVEVNSGGSFALPQIASGRGFLTAENKEFFESCGVNFRKLQRPS